MAVSIETGIYTIQHIASGKVYVGSAVNFAARWRVHRHHLNKQTHHSRHLQAAWNKYGSEAFKFARVLVCCEADLLAYEQIVLDFYQAASHSRGYNMRPLAASSLGVKLTAEAKAKIKIARAKQVFSTETRALWSKNRIGRKLPPRAPRIGFKHTAEAKKRISDAQRGIPQKLQRIERRTGGTLERAKSICEEYARGGISQTALANKHCIDPSTVSLTVRGKRWGKFFNQLEK